jgi:hypothetical protein
MSAKAPIVLFVFNRPEHTLKTINSLTKNNAAKDSDLYIFADGPRSVKDEPLVQKVRDLVSSIDGFKSVTVFSEPKNKGLAPSVIDGVSKIIDLQQKVIVVEDDLEFSPFFLDYMNDALTTYASENEVFSIGGYSPPIQVPREYKEHSYLSYRCCTWGWGTWEDRWKKVDWSVIDFTSFSHDREAIKLFNRGGDDMFEILKQQMAGTISSWGIRWDYAHYKNNAFCFRPVNSIVSNTGNDGTGVHCAPTNKFDVDLDNSSINRLPSIESLKINEEINRRFASFYDGKNRNTANITQILSVPWFRKWLPF